MANYNQAFQQLTQPNHYNQPMQPMQPMRYGYNFGPSDSSNTVPAILVVDSSERNRDLYENAGQYTYNFIKGYTEVVSVQLVKANIPSSGYIVNSSNNLVTFTYGTISYVATLSTGNYTSTQLADELQLQMNTEVGFINTGPAGSRFDVELDSITLVLTITSPSTSPETIVFIAGAIAGADVIIGLGQDNATSTLAGSSHVLVLPNTINLNPDRYMILHIRGLERCNSNNNATQGAFCVIPFDITIDAFTLGQDTINSDSYTYYFTEPLPKFTKMEISFLKRDGSIYDFNGKDHFMVFQITCLSRALRR